MNEIVITNTNGELTTSSLGVAEKFKKQHKDVLEKISNIMAEMNSAEFSAQYFIESVYIDNSGKSNKCYELTRDGFSLLVMGFTGKKALEWKLKYIEAFNLMEQKLRQQSDFSALSPQLQFLIQMEQKQKALESAVKNTNRRIDDMREVMQVRGDNWRKKAHNLVNRIASASGIEQSELYTDIYEELEYRAGCDLDVRYNNLYDRLYERGYSQSKLDRLNNIDVIASDKKLTEIYLSILKEYAVKYSV